MFVNLKELYIPSIIISLCAKNVFVLYLLIVDVSRDRLDKMSVCLIMSKMSNV